MIPVQTKAASKRLRKVGEAFEGLVGEDQTQVPVAAGSAESLSLASSGSSATETNSSLSSASWTGGTVDRGSAPSRASLVDEETVIVAPAALD